MTEINMPELRDLVDHLARRDVVWFSCQEGDELIEISLRPSAQALPMRAVTDAETDNTKIVTAQGPGLFHLRHPDNGIIAPCLESGDFLFPVPGNENDEMLTAAGAVVGYGTPLLRQV